MTTSVINIANELIMPTTSLLVTIFVGFVEEVDCKNQVWSTGDTFSVLKL